MKITAVCEKEEQANALHDIKGITHIFTPENTLPYIFRNEDADTCLPFLDKPDLLIRNLDEAGFLKKHGYRGEIYADHTLYTFNKASRSLLQSLGIEHDTAPLELTYKELKARGMGNSELMIYGRVPMMISAGCVYRNSGNDICRKDIKKGQKVILTDRTDTDFPVLCICKYCYNIILNSVPLSLHAQTDKISALNPESLRLYFTTETESEVKEIAEYFIKLLKAPIPVSDIPAPPYTSYTNGHFKKGIE